MHVVSTSAFLMAASILVPTTATRTAELLPSPYTVVAGADTTPRTTAPIPAPPMTFVPAAKSGCPCELPDTRGCCNTFIVKPGAQPFTVVDPAGKELFKYDPE